jgi:hypothetical protein
MGGADNLKCYVVLSLITKLLCFYEIAMSKLFTLIKNVKKLTIQSIKKNQTLNKENQKIIRIKIALIAFFSGRGWSRRG